MMSGAVCLSLVSRGRPRQARMSLSNRLTGGTTRKMAVANSNTKKLNTVIFNLSGAADMFCMLNMAARKYMLGIMSVNSLCLGRSSVWVQRVYRVHIHNSADKIMENIHIKRVKTVPLLANKTS